MVNLHRVSGQFSSYFFFFLRKSLQHKKRKTSKKQLIKQKQANTKQQKQQSFRAQKLHKRVMLLVLRGFLCYKIFFKKSNRWKIVLITLFIKQLSSMTKIQYWHTEPSEK